MNAMWLNGGWDQIRDVKVSGLASPVDASGMPRHARRTLAYGGFRPSCRTAPISCSLSRNTNNPDVVFRNRYDARQSWNAKFLGLTCAFCYIGKRAR